MDLEHAARHRGSAFGSIGNEDQPTQEHFENRVAMELLGAENAKFVWMEDESRRIGKVILPKALWEQLWSAPVVSVTIPREQRVERLVQDYGEYSVRELGESLQRIGRRLGPEKFRRATEALASSDMATVAEMCLDYYDKYYNRALQERTANPVIVRECSHFDVNALCVLLKDVVREFRRS